MPCLFLAQWPQSSSQLQKELIQKLRCREFGRAVAGSFGRFRRRSSGDLLWASNSWRTSGLGGRLDRWRASPQGLARPFLQDPWNFLRQLKAKERVVLTFRK